MRYTYFRAVLLAVLGTALLAGTACSSGEQRFTGHMARGQEYFEAENFEKARVEFGNALQIKPDDAQARYFSGRVAEKLGNVRDALGAYQAAIEADPGHVEARANLGRVFVFAGLPEKAMEIIEPGIAAHPENADLLTARGAARVQMKDVKGALADAEAAVKNSPDNENAVALLASLYRQSEGPERAAELLRETLKRLPESTDLREVLATLYLSDGDRVLAAEQLEQIVRLKPKNPSYRLQLALLYTRDRKLVEAERILKDGIEQLPESREMKLAYIDFLLAQRSQEAGEKALRDFIAQDEKDFELQLALGGLQDRLGNTQQAMATYQQIIAVEEDRPPALAARNRIAAIHAREGKLAEAGKLIAEVLAKNPRDNDALILRGNLALEQNDASSAVVDLRAVLRDQPEAVGVMRVLARAHLANGETALAEENLRKAMTLAPTDIGIRVELGQLLGQTQRVDQAVTLMEEAVRAAPNDAAVREALARTYLAAGQFDKARSAGEDLRTLRPDLAAGHYLAGVAAVGQSRYADARRDLERALELQPAAVDALMALTNIDIRDGKLPEAITRTAAIVEKTPDNVVARNLLGELYLSAKKFAEARQQFLAATNLAPKWAIPYHNLAATLLAEKNVVAATAAFREGVEATGHEAVLVADFAALLERQGRADEAINLYETALEHNSRQKQTLANNLAMILITHRNDPQTLDRAKSLTADFVRANNSALLDTFGWVRVKSGETVEGLAALERAAELAPKSAEIRYHLGMAQLQAGQKDRAKESLTFALADKRSFTGAGEARAALVSLDRERG